MFSILFQEEEAKVLEGFEANNDEELVKKRRKSPPRAQMPPKSALNLVRAMQSTEPGLSEALDGTPLEDIDGVQIEDESEAPEPALPSKPVENHVKPEVNNKPKGGFLPSKWETIDPEDVKAQAVTTTSKWDLFEEGLSSQDGGNENSGDSNAGGVGGYSGLVADYDEDLDGVPMDEDGEDGGSRNSSIGKVGVEIYEDENSEERRTKLREIENKVLAFQDELESGRKKLKYGESVHGLCQQYREKLARKVGESTNCK
jgi:U2-associated protein SR140